MEGVRSWRPLSAMPRGLDSVLEVTERQGSILSQGMVCSDLSFGSHSVRVSEVKGRFETGGEIWRPMLSGRLRWTSDLGLKQRNAEEV